MPRYRVATPDTKRASNGSYPDFEQPQEVESIVCARHLVVRHRFEGCCVWRHMPSGWRLIFDTTIATGNNLTIEGYWNHVEAEQ